MSSDVLLSFSHDPRSDGILALPHDQRVAALARESIRLSSEMACLNAARHVLAGHGAELSEFAIRDDVTGQATGAWEYEVRVPLERFELIARELIGAGAVPFTVCLDEGSLPKSKKNEVTPLYPEVEAYFAICAALRLVPAIAELDPPYEVARRAS